MRHALPLLVLLWSQVALADAVPPPPQNCPKGYTGHTDHGGPYCQPPPPKCKPGETPRALKQSWYCEPPPPKGGCPAGSAWRSTSRENAWCDGQRCDQKSHEGCSDRPLCVQEIIRKCGFRWGCETYLEERVFSVCGAGGKCAAGQKCVKLWRVAPPAPAKTEPVKKPATPKGAWLLLPLLAGSLLVGRRFRRRP
jgi:hypothetical protein